MSAVSQVTEQYNCRFDNRHLTKVFLHKMTMDYEVYDEYILGEKFQTILIDKGKK